MREKLKYPFYLFIIILIAKFSYVIVESFYNYYVLVTTTSPDANREILEKINKTGHHISSAGITLLLVPIFYIFVKKLSEQKIYIFTAIFSIVMYIASYNLLNSAINYIVQINKEERHNAYYVNIFKYGLLNSAFYYDDFIHRDKIKNNDISIEDRILLTNSFILLYADKNLIEKLKQRGKEALAYRYLNDDDEYHKNFEQYKKFTDNFTVFWNEFNEGRKKLAEEKSKITHEEAYKKFQDDIKKSYTNYIKVWEKIDSQTTSKVIKDTNRKLSKYFRYQGNSRAEKSYKEAIFKQFGEYIEPNSWLDNGKLTYNSIKIRIIKQILNKAGNNLIDVPRDLSPSDFLNNPFIKINVAKQLKSKGILVTKDFDYSFDMFKISFDKFTSQKFQKTIDHFYAELEKRIGKNDLKLDDDWNSFVDSDYLKNQITEKISFTEDLKLQTLLKVIESQDLNKFRDMIYLPKTIKEIEKRMFSHEDFMSDEKAIEYGDDAIRLLYVPPFALAVSILALLLNAVTVLGMSLEYTKRLSSSKIFIVKAVVLVFIILLPFIMGYDGFDNELINSVSNEKFETYFNFLNWIGFYENINSAIH